ncbi:MAG: MarR family winged helix-turn-helix transcriptional regulator [Desulfitobacteriaceae bacterium]
MTNSQDQPDKALLTGSGAEIAENLGQMLGEIVKALHHQFKKQFHEFTGGQELTVSQIFLLRSLVNRGPSSISDLAENLNLANSTVSGIVDRLERDGFVMRVRDKADRRIVYVQLTERAERLKEQVPQFHQMFLNDLLQGVDERTLYEMSSSFQILYDLIQRFEEREKGT